MKINPILRFVLLGLVVVINFFVVVLIINSLSTTNQQINDLKVAKRKQETQRVNYRVDTERKIDENIRLNQNTENIELINFSETIKIVDILPKNNTQNSTNANKNTNTTIRGY